MLMESEMMTRILPGSVKIILYVIIVVRVPEFIVLELYEIRGGLKGNLIIIATLMFVLNPFIIGINPRQKIV